MRKTVLTQSGAQVQEDLDFNEGLFYAFSTNATYSVGDIVRYQDQLYKCHTAVSVAGAWTGSTNWTAGTADELLAGGSAPSDVEYLSLTSNNYIQINFTPNDVSIEPAPHSPGWNELVAMIKNSENQAIEMPVSYNSNRAMMASFFYHLNDDDNYEEVDIDVDGNHIYIYISLDSDDYFIDVSEACNHSAATDNNIYISSFNGDISIQDNFILPSIYHPEDEFVWADHSKIDYQINHIQMLEDRVVNGAVVPVAFETKDGKQAYNARMFIEESLGDEYPNFVVHLYTSDGEYMFTYTVVDGDYQIDPESIVIPEQPGPGPSPSKDDEVDEEYLQSLSHQLGQRIYEIAAVELPNGMTVSPEDLRAINADSDLYISQNGTSIYVPCDVFSEQFEQVLFRDKNEEPGNYYQDEFSYKLLGERNLDNDLYYKIQLFNKSDKTDSHSVIVAVCQNNPK